MNLQDLYWLPEPADDFRSQIRQLRDNADASLLALRRLATSRLNLTQLHALSGVLERISRTVEGGWVKLTLLSNASTDLIVSALPATALRHALLLEVKSVPYGTFMQEAMDAESETNTGNNDFIVLALDYRAFGFQATTGDLERSQQQIDEALQTVLGLVTAIRRQGGASVVLQTLAAPAQTFFGSLDQQLPGTLQWLIAHFNIRLRALHEPGTLLFDVAALAASYGLNQWHDASQWVVGKFPFAHAAVPLYAEHLSRVLMAARGKAKKCLVLDLDNTLWGGVIGDDGMDAIVLGQGSPVGEAHLSVQETALALRARGVVLAVSSKNEEKLARQVFRQHPDMLLREEHIAVFQANWQDKASNLRAIAHSLNLGIDALVLLDDNPAERQQVRLELPGVGVPELPEGPEFFPSTLLAAGYFDAISYTEDDQNRAGQYQANAARAAILGTTTDLGAYLESLQMQVHISPFNAVGRARIVQLINKTNQFNLTTRRYSDGDVEAFESDPKIYGRQIRLKDRFGDNGMVSVILCKPQGSNCWLIDTWLMSCRVLNRGLERQVLNAIMTDAARAGIEQVVGQYRPTEKNGLVKDHYSRLGFSVTPNGDWVQSVAEYRMVPMPIEVVDDPATRA